MANVSAVTNLSFQLVPLRELSFHLPVDILLEFLHVEQLEGLVHVQQAIGQLQDVVGHGRLLRCVLHIDVSLAHLF